MGCEFMKENMEKVIDFEEYKNKKKKIEVDRVELLKLIKQIVMTKQRANCSLFYFEKILKTKTF